MQHSLKVSLRLLFGAALLVCALLLLAARADAAETDAPPVAEAPPIPTQELSPDPADLAPPAPEPTEPQPQTTPPAGAGGPDGDEQASTTPPPDNVNDQQAHAQTDGTAVADTGNNTATSGASGASATPAPTETAGPTTVDSDADVTTGDASGVGTTGSSAVDQQAAAQATEQGAVDIIQIALVVNVGVSHANSGANGAAATGSGGVEGTSNTAGIGTGDAGATGNLANTTVTQAAQIDGGDDSTQIATVINIGIGVGNTGLNVALAGIDVSGLPNGTQIILLGDGSNAAGVASGDADSIGNRANTQITQQAAGTASGTAVLVIDQRAVVVNFGISFANTGGNAALAGGEIPPEVMAQLQAVLSLLAPLLADFQSSGGSPAASGAANIATGNATAIGNDARTSVTQLASGDVTGDEYARASQQAIVANFGLALANSGFNLAIAGGGGYGGGAELATVNSELSRFFALLSDLSWLTGENPFADFAKTVDLNGMTLELGGDISGVEFLVGWDDALFPDGGPIPGGVRVRQITAVLDLGFVVADSGSNVAVAVVSGREATGHDVQAGNGAASVVMDAAARIGTGDAFAVGNDVVVLVCQTFNEDASVCAPDEPEEPEEPEEPGGETPEPEPPVVVVEPRIAGPEAPTATPVRTPERAGATLPVTGGDARSTIATALGMLALGGLFSSRRRRPARRVVR